jgi:hypothetical protein
VNEDGAVNGDVIEGAGDGGEFGALICLSLPTQSF